MKVPKIPDTLTSKAHLDARAARKAFEKENPHFDMQEFGMKAGALALLAAAALFPWEKEYEKHQRTHHPERFQDNNDGDGDGRKGRGGRERERDGGEERRRRRRQSEGGEGEREYRRYLDRDREYRPLVAVETAPSSVGGGARGGERERRYTGSEDGEYGRRYIEASRRERERMGRASGEDGRRRRGDSMDYYRRRNSREEWRR